MLAFWNTPAFPDCATGLEMRFPAHSEAERNRGWQWCVQLVSIRKALRALPTCLRERQGGCRVNPAMWAALPSTKSRPECARGEHHVSGRFTLPNRSVPFQAHLRVRLFSCRIHPGARLSQPRTWTTPPGAVAGFWRRLSSHPQADCDHLSRLR